VSALADAALEYAERGWYVFPLRPCRKEPLTRHGFKDASRELELVRAWWTTSPVANIGIDCGRSRLVVVDLDGEQGEAVWADMMASRGGHGPTLVAATGDGCHLYFAGESLSSTRRLGEGIDTRGAGGYVVAPPSVHPSGATYRWLDASAPLAPAPAWLLAAFEPPSIDVTIGERQPLPLGTLVTSYGRAALEGLVDQMLRASEGCRNHTLLAVSRRAGRLEAAGELHASLAERVLLDAARSVGLSPIEAKRTFESGFQFGRQYPALRAPR
jgi:hypothetical protein